MKLNFLKNFGQRIIFSLVSSAAITLAAVGAVAAVLVFAERALVRAGYRSALVGLEGMRPESRVLLLVLIALLVFSVSFYLFIRPELRYIREIIDKVRDISGGDFEQPVRVRGTDELSVMAANLNVMQKNIQTLLERERIAEHTKNDLISSLAHDLRTPLTSVIGYLGWVQTRQDLDEATRGRYLSIAYENACRLEQLTEELFGFVKLTHAELELHISRLDLVQLAGQVLDELTPAFVQNELTVEFEHEEESLPMEGDGELLARMLGNLLNNAVKYGREGKQIRVHVSRSGGYAVLRVVNYGRVIPRSELGSIFRKFYRTEQSRSRDTGGTGLGLAIVEQIVRLHHGQIRAKSDLQGTVFEAELPVVQGEGESRDEEKE